MSVTHPKDERSTKDVTDLRDIVGTDNLAATIEANVQPVDLAVHRSASTIPTNVEQPNWQDAFTRGTLTGDELESLTVTPRGKLLADWFCESDLGFIFAQRGVGKTYLGMMVALAVAEGGTAGPWRSEAQRPVLYVDGEMPLELMQSRNRELSSGTGFIRYLNHEQLFEQTGQVLNLTSTDTQEAITARCLDWNIKLLVLDNLSCLFRGVKENDADAWEQILPWLLELRRRKIAVIFVVHAGRNGQMRGTSRREDAAAWVIRLDDAADSAIARTGARFISTFTKPSRNTPRNPAPLEWSITTSAGRATVTAKEAEGGEAVIGWVHNGLTGCREIALEMGVSPGTVSKLATKLMAAGRLKKDGREYALVTSTKKSPVDFE